MLTTLNTFSEVCVVKIENGAHSLLGKLVARMWKKQKANKSNASSSSGQQRYQRENTSDEDLVFMHKNRIEKPYKREYILRSSVSRPAPYSRQSPQRMYVLLTDEEFRLAGAFTEDTMFF